MKQVPYGEIQLLDECQTRAAIDNKAIEEYRSIYKAKRADGLPPLRVVDTGEELILWDGFHRIAAAEGVLKFVNVEPKRGTRADAIYLATGANTTHGVRRTDADKRKAVEMALGLERFASASSRAVAEHVGVSHSFVEKVRKDLEGPAPQERTGMDGKTYRARTPEPEIPETDYEPELGLGSVGVDSTSEETAEETIQRYADLQPPDTHNYDRAIEMLESTRRALNATCKASGDQVFCQVADALKAQEERIKDAMPVVCPSCGGMGCERCKDKGVVTTRAARALRGAA